MSGKDKPKEKEREDKKDHNLGGGSMMDNISRMIPAPPNAQRGMEDSMEQSDEGAW